MKVFIIDNPNPLKYDSYDSHVVVANDEEEVRELAIAKAASEGKEVWKTASIEYLGEYTGKIHNIACIVCSSFYSG